MKLTELVNSVSSHVREVTNFVRYPLENVSRIFWNRAQQEYEKIEVPAGKNNSGKESPVQETKTRRLETNTAVAEPKETATAVKVAVAEQLAKKQSRGAEVTPILTKDHKIQGRKGRYRINDLLKDGERVRLYQGEQVINNKPILIKEYLLPDREFNQKEARERKEKFERVVSVNLRNGGGQDFRLISPWDAIAPLNEKRCYLIVEQTIKNNSTLREYLDKNDSMTCKQVRRVLNQVLQTLWFLHSQKLRLSSDDVRLGLPHGNLNLDSLLIVTNNQETVLDDPQFFIYLSDLALWEDLFKPPTAKIVNHSPEKDLIDLGYISFYLLSGGTVDRVFGQPLDPKIEQHWPPVKDVALKRFIYHLLGVNKPFASAYEARQALLELPPEEQIEESIEATTEPNKKEEVKHSQFLRLLLTALVLGLLVGFAGQFIWLLWQALNTGEVQVPIISRPSATCCFAKVEKIPTTEEIKYATEADGTWSYILNKPSLVSYGKTLEQELKEREPRFQNYILNTSANTSIENIIEQVRSGRANFALVSLSDEDLKNKDKLLDGMKMEEVAYDGLVVFVAFSDNQRKRSVPSALKGKITIEQLRELYSTGKLKNWSPPEGLKNGINLYMPLDSSRTMNLFEQLVFKDKPPGSLSELKQENQKREWRKKAKMINDKIAKVNRDYPERPRGWRRERIQKQTENIQKIKNDESYIAGQILNDFEENETVSFGFGLLSRVFNQCSVYPLAVGEKEREIQPLVQKVESNVKPIDPKMDLCNDKGSYKPNVEAFKSGKYPLRYRLVVVYSVQDENRSLAGKKFVELLKTDEGQRLLSEAGLVPIRSLPND